MPQHRILHQPSVMSLRSPVIPLQPDKVADLKLVLLGESAVGKSSLVQRFNNNSFDDHKESTIGAAFITKKVFVNEDNSNSQEEEEEQDGIIKQINFQIWDTAGQERYKSLTPMYYRNSQIAVVMFDLSDFSSFQKAEYWINELKMYISDTTTESGDTVPLRILLVGNKLDLLDASQNKVCKFQDKIDEYLANDVTISFFKTSCKEGHGIDEIFQNIIDNLNPKLFNDVDDDDYDVLDRNRKKRKNGNIVDLSSFSISSSGCQC